MLRRLAFVRAARNVGLSLEEVATALATLPGGRAPTRADWARLSRGWKTRLDLQIEALTALRDGLASCIGCGCLSLRRCAISNPDDVAAGNGPGAVYLPRPLRAPVRWSSTVIAATLDACPARCLTASPSRPRARCRRSRSPSWGADRSACTCTCRSA